MVYTRSYYTKRNSHLLTNCKHFKVAAQFRLSKTIGLPGKIHPEICVRLSYSRLQPVANCDLFVLISTPRLYARARTINNKMNCSPDNEHGPSIYCSYGIWAMSFTPLKSRPCWRRNRIRLFKIDN